MTQLFGSSSGHNERKTPSSPSSNNGRFGSSSSSSSSHFPTKLKNFFRINSLGSNNSNSSSNASSNGELQTSHLGGSLRPKSRFLRGRSTSSASQLDGAEISPTANANPYFAHQGPPALRHHNDGSAPPSPPETPELSLSPPGGGISIGVSGLNDQQLQANKEELARKLRRVASAPNAQGLFSSEDRPPTATEEEGGNGRPPSLNYSQAASPLSNGSGELRSTSTSNLLPVPHAGEAIPERLRNGQFRRTYSSNSIKVRNVEVGPGSFDKIKLLGKGDVGKVYLVREKKSNRLYAMKGQHCFSIRKCSGKGVYG